MSGLYCLSNRFVALKILIIISLFDLFTNLFLLIFYITSVDLISYFKVFQFIAFAVLIRVGISSFKLFMKNSLSSYFILFLILLEFSKVFFVNLDELDFYALSTRFYTLLMWLFSFSFAYSFTLIEFNRIVCTFIYYSKVYFKLAFFIIIAYFFLYYSGFITYFGFGLNLYYYLPFLFLCKRFSFLWVIIVILSGKRSLLVSVFVQFFVRFVYLKKPIHLLFNTFIFCLSIFVLVSFTDLLDRIILTFNVDFNDEYSVLVAFSGRFEEVLSVIDYFNKNTEQLFFGSLPSEYYVNYIYDNGLIFEWYKNYSHVSPFTILFRYGILGIVFFIFVTSYLLVKYYNRSNPFYIAFIAIVVSSFMGATVFVDFFSSLLIGFFIRFKDSNFYVQK